MSGFTFESYLKDKEDSAVRGFGGASDTFTAPLPQQSSGGFFGKTPEQDEFKKYRETGGKLVFDQWKREKALKQSEVTGTPKEDVLRGLSGHVPMAEAREQRSKTFQEHPLFAQFMGGVGDVISTGGSALEWLGKNKAKGLGVEDVGANFQEMGKEVSRDITQPDLGEITWKSAIDPAFWAKVPSFAARMTPFTLSLVPAMIVGYGASATGGAALGLGAMGSAILGAIGGSVLSRPIEGVLEAGGTYNEAKQRGMDEKAADKAATSVFLKNLSLSGMDAAELATAFMPTPVKLGGKYLKPLIAGGRVVGTMGQEALEEGLQQKWQTEALGDKFKWLDPETRTSMFGGALMGGAMGGAGAVFNSIKSQTKKNIPPSMTKKFDGWIAEGLKQGKNQEQAELYALDKLAETPVGKRIIEQATKWVEGQSQQGNAIPPSVQAVQGVEARLKPEVTKATQYSIDKVANGLKNIEELAPKETIRESAVRRKQLATAYENLELHARKLGAPIPKLGTYYHPEQYLANARQMSEAVQKSYAKPTQPKAELPVQPVTPEVTAPSNEVVTVSGRKLIAPQIRVTSNIVASRDSKKADEWLLTEAKREVESPETGRIAIPGSPQATREFQRGLLANINPKKMTEADKATAWEILTGESEAPAVFELKGEPTAKKKLTVPPPTQKPTPTTTATEKPVQAPEAVSKGIPPSEPQFITGAGQAGLPGVGPSEFQTQAFAEYGGAGQKPKLLDVEAFKTQNAAKAELERLKSLGQASLEETAAPEEVLPETFGLENQGEYEALAQTEGLSTAIRENPVASKRIWVGTSKNGKPLYRGLDFFISLREQSFPNYFTLKQARLLKPEGNFTRYTEQGTSRYNKVPRDEVLDEISEELGLSGSEELAEKVMELRQTKRELRQVESLTAQDITPLEETPKVTLSTQLQEIYDSIKVNLEATQAALAGVKGAEALKHRQLITRLENELANIDNIKVQTEVTEKINEIQRNPLSAIPEDAKYAHTELVAPDGPKPPRKPPTKAKGANKEPSEIFQNVLDSQVKGERLDETVMRVYGASARNLKRRTSITVTKISNELHALGIGVIKRGYVVPRESDKPILDALYNALHNPSKVATGEIQIPKGFENVYKELRNLADWDTASRIDFDPEAATLEDWFFRGWKPPEGMVTGAPKGQLGTKPKVLKAPRVDATYQEMRDAGFEPLFWNPAQQWGYRHNIGEAYREQMQLVSYLKSLDSDLIRPDAGGPAPEGWRVPRIGPAFEGKPFATKDADGKPAVMFTRRWIVPDRTANLLETMFGTRPNIGTINLGGKTINPLDVIDWIAFVPKRAKLLLSFFQHMDFLTRAGGGTWGKAIDDITHGKPLKAATAILRYPKTVGEILHANFSPGKRLSLAEQMDDTTPIIQGRPGITLKGIMEAGLSTMDETILSSDMDKLMRSIADDKGFWDTLKGAGSSVVDMESAMRRGLFGGTYPAAMMTDIKNNIAVMMVRQHPTATDKQINGYIAKETNKKYSTLPPEQSVVQNKFIREVLRRITFSFGESEALLRQATSMLHGPNKRFWMKQNLGVALFVLVVANIIHFASTGEPLPKERYVPIAKDNYGPLPFGYNTKFLSPTIPLKGRGNTEITVDLMGQMDTAFRVLNPAFFMSSRFSVPVRAAINQVSGTDFYGAPIDDVGPGGVYSRTAQLAIDMFAPIGVGGIATEAVREYVPGTSELIPRAEDRLGMGGLALQATGVNLRAEGTIELLDRYARESGYQKRDGTPVEVWDDLEPKQVKELEKEIELQKELDVRSETSIERNVPNATSFAEMDKIDQRYYLQEEALGEEYLEAARSGFTTGITHEEFRDQYRKIQSDRSLAKSENLPDEYKNENELPKDPNKRALAEYYQAFDKATTKSGRLDWNLLDKIMAGLNSGWTPEQKSYIEENTGLREHPPLIAEYRKDMELLADYWNVPENDVKSGPRSLMQVARESGTGKAPLRSQADTRIAMRKADPAIDAALVRWYGYKPVNSTAVATKSLMQVARESGVTPTPPKQPSPISKQGASATWQTIWPELNSTSLKALDELWFKSGTLPPEAEPQLRQVFAKYPLGQTNFNAWVKQTLRQVFQNATVAK
uniref:Large polyvalent protein associated domain-containing protein n=1 Tax=viral metagenome TaxID=1070528 RepID=A0A6M3J3A2_9ZZZZ